MAFHLTEAELDRAKAAIERHGYSIFFPTPPEWNVVLKNWDDIRSHLTKQDLDLYKPREPLHTYAPKSRINLRPVSLLHPYDLLIYTALTVVVRDDIEAARDRFSRKRVFSHRSTPALVNALYEPAGSAHSAYRKRQKERASRRRCTYVAVTDIADFFPRLYQHRLENVIRNVAGNERSTDVARVLVEKFLLNVSRGDSYGVPIGPFASSILAEAILIDVDAALIDQGFDFARWFDDFSFFSQDEADAQRALFFLAQWLHDNHGLSLSTAKTKLLRKKAFLKGISLNYERRIKRRSNELARLWAIQPYVDETQPLTAEQRAEVDSFNLASILTEAIERKRGVDYELADFILKKLAHSSVFSREQALELIAVVLRHLPDLYPIISTVSSFFAALSGMSNKDTTRIAKALLAPLTKRDPEPPEFVAMWILEIFASSVTDWNHANVIRRIYSNATSPIVKRHAALALAKNATRAQALVTRRDLGGAKPLVRTAILCAWNKLGSDERKHWKQMELITDPLERIL